MMLARHNLAALGEDPQSIEEMLDEARAGHYARVRAFFHSIEDVDLLTTDHHHLHSIEILPRYHAIERSIESLRCLGQIKVIGLRRNGVTSDNPLPGGEFKPGDVLIIAGHADDIQAAAIEIMSGL